PKLVCVNGASLRSRTLMGRSVKNCLRLDQKSSGIKIAGRPNLGTCAGRAWFVGLAGCEPVVDTLAFGAEGGTSLLILPGTVYPLNIDGLALPLVSLRDRIPPGRERLRAPTADTYLRFIVTYKTQLLFDVSRRELDIRTAQHRQGRIPERSKLWPNHLNSKRR